MSFCRYRNAAVGGVSRVVLCLAALVISAPFSVSAQSYLQPRVLSRAGTGLAIPGPGTVVVQIEIFPDGKHRVERVLSASNPGDIPAALDIAKNSTYAPATRDGKPVVSYYEYTLTFTGKSLSGVASSTGGGGGNSVYTRAQQLMRAGNYVAAQTHLQAALQHHPNDTMARELLGLSYYYQKDFVSAANTYQQVPTIDKPFIDVAAQSFSNVAVSYATGSNGTASNPNLALRYAQKALQLAPNASTYFALGTVQLKSQDTANAVINLQKARDLGFADPKTDATSRIHLDGALLQAYAQAGDMQNAQRVSDEIMKLDPKSSLPGEILGAVYLHNGDSDVQAKRSDSALANFTKAASYGDPQITANAYARAAFVMVNLDKPDFGKAKDYADKSLAADPNNPLGNWAEGVSYAGQYATSQNPDMKKQAQAACAKASQLARAQGNTSLADQIDKYVEANLK